MRVDSTLIGQPSVTSSTAKLFGCSVGRAFLSRAGAPIGGGTGMVDDPDVRVCAACQQVARCYRILRIATEEAYFPDSAIVEGGVGTWIDGHVPLCPDCILVCPTCEQPVLAY